jgi:hypothetical protein
VAVCPLRDIGVSASVAWIDDVCYLIGGRGVTLAEGLP